MKKQSMKLAAILFLTLAVVSCKKAKNETDAKVAEEVSTVADANEFPVDPETSTITWKGTKPTGSHDGNIKISEGVVNIEDGKLVGGNFIIDMNSITNRDLEDKAYNEKLVGHLKSDDFFDIEKHPFSAFTITSVVDKEGKTMVKGNLSIKGIKKNIKFPVSVSKKNETILIKSESFSIDRTEWDIKFRSGKFFEDLKDKLIDDNIKLKFDVRATKATI